MKKLLFQKTTLRMTGMYLLVLMTLSMLFSLTLYRVLGSEIDQNYARSIDFADRFGGFRPDPLQRNIFLKDREAEHTQGKTRLVNQLFVINVSILGVGGVLCYVLARRTLQPIEEAHEALERFTSDASHELRTPLAVMRTEIEVALMNQKLTVKDAKTLLNSNLEEVERLTHLSERLLLLARLDENGLPKQKIDISEVILKATEIAQTSAAIKSIDINLVVPETGVLLASGDKESLTELLVILLDNAVKYSNNNTKITIKALQTSKAAVIEVSDMGVGILADHLPHIFDRFYRADGSRTSGDGHGYGLGLALAQKIAHLHGGTITATSKLGKGSTFTVAIPIA